MKKQYDIAIIGGGIGGLMAAWRLTERAPSLSVALFEKGSPIEKRVCPIITKKVSTCVKCKSCAIMEGLAGAGAFSDGKYVISTEYGGWLTEFLPDETVHRLHRAGGSDPRQIRRDDRAVPAEQRAQKRCASAYDLHMSQAQLKHLGTDSNFETMTKPFHRTARRSGCEIHTDTDVVDVDRAVAASSPSKTAEGEQQPSTPAGSSSRSAARAAASSPAGASRNGIPLDNNQVDVGVRVELPADRLGGLFRSSIYEPKIWYRSKRLRRQDPDVLLQRARSASSPKTPTAF